MRTINTTLLNRKNLVLAVSLALAGLSLPAANAGTIDTASGLYEGHCAAMPSPTPDPAYAPVATCFPTFAAALFFATGGTVVVDGKLQPGELTDEILEPSTAGDHIVIGVDYEHTSNGGLSLIWYGHATCSATVSYYATSMPAGWNDRVSSAVAFGGCDIYIHYEHDNFGGALQACTCSSMGAMNDKTSSEKWFD